MRIIFDGVLYSKFYGSGSKLTGIGVDLNMKERTGF